MSHTPGPWVVRRDTNCQDVLYVEENGVVVCETMSADAARLIAAAPEMLEALKFLRCTKNHEALSDRAVDIVDAAIAKAERQETESDSRKA